MSPALGAQSFAGAARRARFQSAQQSHLGENPHKKTVERTPLALERWQPDMNLCLFFGIVFEYSGPRLLMNAAVNTTIQAEQCGDWLKEKDAEEKTVLMHAACGGAFRDILAKVPKKKVSERETLACGARPGEFHRAKTSVTFLLLLPPGISRGVTLLTSRFRHLIQVRKQLLATDRHARSILTHAIISAPTDAGNAERVKSAIACAREHLSAEEARLAGTAVGSDSVVRAQAPRCGGFLDSLSETAPSS